MATEEDKGRAAFACKDIRRAAALAPAQNHHGAQTETVGCKARRGDRLRLLLLLFPEVGSGT